MKGVELYGRRVFAELQSRLVYLKIDGRVSTYGTLWTLTAKFLMCCAQIDAQGAERRSEPCWP